MKVVVCLERSKLTPGFLTGYIVLKVHMVLQEGKWCIVVRVTQDLYQMVDF